MIEKEVFLALEFDKVLTFIAKYCITANGRQNILSSLPFENQNEILNEGMRVSQAKEILIQQSVPPIDFLPDLVEDLAISGIEGALLSAKKILEIKRLAEMSRNTFQFLKSVQIDASELKELTQNLFVDKVFEHLINQVITETGEIKDKASKKLFEIRQEIAEKKNDLNRIVQRISKKFIEEDFTREEFITLRDGRMVIPVKAEHKRHIKGFIHSESSTGQTVYIEPEETLQMNNEIISLQFAEKREIERILKEVTKKIGTVRLPLQASLKALAQIDAVFAKAKYSIEIIGNFPSLLNDKPFFLQDGKHPILLNKFGQDKTIPLSFAINGGKIIVITGPNAGGKTVVLKTTGLLSLMVMCGMHIPAQADSNFHMFEKILVDIGDKQSLEDDLSTFSSHILNLKNILEEADGQSLILLDEIGTGTEPSAGGAFAAAVLLSLNEKGATVLSTTHHNSLKVLAHQTEGFENASMEFDLAAIKPTYRFKQGFPGSSYAFEIAKRIGFEDDFLNDAKGFLENDQQKMETMLLSLEERSNSLNDQLQQISIENSRLKSLTNLYQQKNVQLEKEKKEILRKTKQEAESFLIFSKKTIEKTIKEIKERKADKESIKITRDTIANLDETIKDFVKEDIDLSQNSLNFEIGDYVQIKSTATSGKIFELSKDKKEASILVGSLKIQVKTNALAHTKKEAKKVTESVSYSPMISEIQYRLDLRGEKPEHAEFEVVKFLDNAYTGNYDRVEILHGKGTGALKKMVKEILQKHEGVKNFYFAPVEFGGEGITIVELK
ncbi:MAG: endonuclease MutS2 [Ignavibacteriaceae bacterium]|nr:endonuclease MutS2 [Ignavibacteriaceae bacterium]